MPDALLATGSLDILRHELPMELGTNGVVDERRLLLSLINSAGAILEHHIIVPASLHSEIGGGLAGGVEERVPIEDVLAANFLLE